MFMDAYSKDRTPAVWLQILNDSGEPEWHSILMWEMVSAALPENWTVAIDEKSTIRFAPASWLEPGFWDRFFGHGSQEEIRKAHETYRHELELINAAS